MESYDSVPTSPEAQEGSSRKRARSVDSAESSSISHKKPCEEPELTDWNESQPVLIGGASERMALYAGRKAPTIDDVKTSLDTIGRVYAGPLNDEIARLKTRLYLAENELNSVRNQQ